MKFKEDYKKINIEIDIQVMSERIWLSFVALLRTLLVWNFEAWYVRGIVGYTIIKLFNQV